MLSNLKNRQKDDDFCRKNIILFLKEKMELPLPLDQLRFNIVLRILITAYGASGIWNFFAIVPWCSEEDAEILWCHRNTNYSFWLISSLLFFLLWISQFQYAYLVYLSMWEIYLIIIIYLWLIVKKRKYSNHNKQKLTTIKKNVQVIKMDKIKSPSINKYFNNTLMFIN